MNKKQKTIISTAISAAVFYVLLVAFITWPLFRLSLIGIIIDPVLWIIGLVTFFAVRKAGLEQV